MDHTKALEKYEEWVRHACDDPATLLELKSICGNEAEIEDRFYCDLAFGTGGLRGILGVGTNRMNVYTVRKVTQGLADYILQTNAADTSIVIGYDSRIKSDCFAKAVAEVLAANRIKAILFSTLVPTPMVSFATRELGAAAGINITASHNPAEYNGYKVYGADGCQITDSAADAILAKINAVDLWNGVKYTEFDQAEKTTLIHYVEEQVIEAYYSAVKGQMIRKDFCMSEKLKVVYTPLNGAGNIPVKRILGDVGVDNIVVVPEQEKPDGNFPTCPSPNPESKEALQKGLALCEKERPDLLLATDPDCDRVGIAVPNPHGEYVLLNGNETGVLLLEYIIKERLALGMMPKQPVAIKTIVTTPLANKICDKYNVKLIDVLTGFKYIGEKIGELQKEERESSFIFGLEESYGYLAGTYARDKDAVVASMLICEMTAYYKSKGVGLYQKLQELYLEYGYFYSALESYTFAGAAGMQKMRKLMTKLRDEPPVEINHRQIIQFRDYLNPGEASSDLPAADVVSFVLEDTVQIIIRMSGTEPKLKIYYSVAAENMAEAKKKQKLYSDYFVSNYLGPAGTSG